VEFYNAEVIASSRNLANLKKAMTDLRMIEQVKIMELDASKTDDVAKIAKSERVEELFTEARKFY